MLLVQTQEGIEEIETPSSSNNNDVVESRTKRCETTGRSGMQC